MTTAQNQAQRAFIERAMAMVQESIYPGVTDGVFAREWQDLVMAVSEPAAFLRERGLYGTAPMYLEIIRTVLDGIVEHGEVGQSRSRPMYLRRCLQTHLRINSERYLDAAKALQTTTAGDAAARILRRLQPVAGDPAADRLTEALVAARGLIQPPPRRPARKTL